MRLGHVRLQSVRALAIFVSLILMGLNAEAQAPAEAAAYTKVSEARTLVMRIGNRSAIRAFRRKAEEFVDAYPRSSRCPTVYLWLGDLLKDADPRAALRFYRRSTVPDASKRASDLAFRFDPPPALQIDRWIGTAMDPAQPDGRVTLLFFFSTSHPSANPLTRRIEVLRNRLGPQGLRVIGVAAVLDDHQAQRPERVAEMVRERKLPFPVGVDRQREKDRSVSLALYRGVSVPWGAFLDRYGRIVWIGPLPVEKNVFQRCEAKLQALLTDLPYDKLYERARTGDEAALRKLASIKTATCATTLFRLRAAAPPGRLKPMIDEALKAILPRGFGPQSADLWKESKERYRYSFEEDRLVRRYPSERVPVADER